MTKSSSSFWLFSITSHFTLSGLCTENTRCNFKPCSRRPAPSHPGTQVRIEGPHERYIQRGSILAVTCTVDHKGRAGPQQVAWYQGAARLHYDSPRGGIALQVGGDGCVCPQAAGWLSGVGVCWCCVGLFRRTGFIWLL